MEKLDQISDEDIQWFVRQHVASGNKKLNINDFFELIQLTLSPVPGMLTPGNINLLDRPVIKNSDGTVSTESSKSFGFGGKEVILPTIIGGKRVSDREAINHYRKTGEHLGIFNDVKTANEYAEKIHNRFNNWED